jgi:hypothetical protein
LRNPEPRLATPLLATDEPICETGKLACGNGDCIDKELFCNGAPDCADGSDENACSESSITLCNTLSTTKLWQNFFQTKYFFYAFITSRCLPSKTVVKHFLH